MQTSLKARLGVFSTTAIVVGTMIGSGIFKKTAPMAALLGSADLIILVWVVAGLVTLCGALSVAEVTAMMPQSGGQYRFYHHMYGERFAFLSGWSIFTVIQTGSIAAIAYVFSDYANSIVPLPALPASLVQSASVSLPLFGTVSVLDTIGVKLLTCGLIIALTVVNVRGVHFGGGISSVLTVLKIAAVLTIIIAGLLASGVTPGTGAAGVPPVRPSPIIVPTGWSLLIALTFAMSKAFWAYDGWGSIAYIGDEVREARRTLPIAIIAGVTLVVAVYVAINLAYLHALPVDVIARSTLVAADVMIAAIGSGGALFVAIVVMVSTLGAVNGTILNSARVYYAMACDGLFFASLKRVHPRHATPHVSLYTQCAWSCVLVVTGTFETLTDMLIFVSWIYYGMSALGVFILRR
ncbi:MAG: APC family permease, partial [Candidatus Kapaibacterium sp.]